jgi:hypothetical protein
MLRRVTLVRTYISEKRISLSTGWTRIAEYSHPDEGDTFIQNVCSYKSHKAWHPEDVIHNISTLAILDGG